MKLRVRLILFALAAASSMLATAAQAVPITVELSGTVATVDDVDDLFGGAFSVGMPFTATIAYDTSVPDIDPSSTIGRYEENPASQLSITMSLGGVDISTSTVTSEAIFVVRSDTNLFLPSVNDPVSTGPALIQMQMILDSSNPLAITSDELPTSLNLADFDGNRQMALVASSFPSFGFVFADIETLTVVPEPGTGALLGLALAFLLRRRGAAT